LRRLPNPRSRSRGVFAPSVASKHHAVGDARSGRTCPSGSAPWESPGKLGGFLPSSQRPRPTDLRPLQDVRSSIERPRVPPVAGGTTSEACRRASRGGVDRVRTAASEGGDCPCSVRELEQTATATRGDPPPRTRVILGACRRVAAAVVLPDGFDVRRVCQFRHPAQCEVRYFGCPTGGATQDALPDRGPGGVLGRHLFFLPGSIPLRVVRYHAAMLMKSVATAFSRSWIVALV